MKIQTRRTTKAIKADDEIDETVDDVDTAVEEEADLLFESEDVAELLAEVTGEAVDMEVTDDAVVFTVGDEEFEITPEGDEESLEACTKTRKRAVQAATKTRSARTRRGAVKASTQTAGKVIRKLPRTK